MVKEESVVLLLVDFVGGGQWQAPCECYSSGTHFPGGRDVSTAQIWLTNELWRAVS